MAGVKVTVKWNQSALNLINQKAIRGLFKMGTDLANQARRNAPYKTGALSNSIRVAPNGVVVEVIAGGNRVPYAAIQEFGGYAGRNRSVHITGKHYMERARDFVMTGNYLKRYFGGISR